MHYWLGILSTDVILITCLWCNQTHCLINSHLMFLVHSDFFSYILESIVVQVDSLLSIKLWMKLLFVALMKWDGNLRLDIFLCPFHSASAICHASSFSTFFLLLIVLYCLQKEPIIRADGGISRVRQVIWMSLKYSCSCLSWLITYIWICDSSLTSILKEFPLFPLCRLLFLLRRLQRP